MEKLSWGGFFAVAKHISSVDPVALEDMDEVDWAVLDFPALRPAARAKLVRTIEAGKLEGFFRVNYDMHKRVHGGKPTYYYPATNAQVDAFESGEYGESNFENFEDYEDEPDAEFRPFEERRSILEERGTTVVAPAVYAAFRILRQEEEPRQQRDFYRLQDWAVAILFLSTLRKMTVEALKALAKEFGATETDLFLAGQDEERIIDLIISLL